MYCKICEWGFVNPHPQVADKIHVKRLDLQIHDTYFCNENALETLKTLADLKQNLHVTHLGLAVDLH